MLADPQCFNCKHYHGGDSYTCRAFPQDIPDEIILNRFDHTEQYPGDQGFRFELLETSKRFVRV